MINKEIIAQRKEQYGNNFPKLAELINNYLSNFKNDGEPILPEDAAIIMALMKVSRLANSPHHEDSLIDLINYMWIALNYDQYDSLDGADKPKSPYMNINKSDFDVNRMIRNVNNLAQKINKTEHTSGNTVDIPTLRFADFVLAYLKTKPLD